MATAPCAAQPVAPADLPPFARPALGPRGPLPAEQEAARQQYLAQARQALQAGDAAAAQQPLDQAAAMRHTADTELLMVQQMMQRGAYRQALAFAAHAAGAHADVPQARALYGWLAAVGGQPAFADAQLTLGLQRLPDDAVLLGMRQALAGLQPGAPGLPAEARVPGPWATGAEVPAAARAIGSGVLLAGGRLAWVVAPGVQSGDAVAAGQGSAGLGGVAPSGVGSPAAAAGSAAPRASRFWLRDGLGRTRAATLQQHWPASGLALMALAAPLEGATPPAAAPQPAFAGSPAVVVGHLRAEGTAAAWPALHLGFLGRPAADAAQALGVGLPAELPGAPVLDLSGRLLGLTLPAAADGTARFLPLGALRPLLGAQAETLLPAAPAAPAPRRTPDELYEAALPAMVQLLGVEQPQPPLDPPTPTP